MKQLVLTSIFLFLQACSLVELTPAGRNVELRRTEQLGGCTKTAETTVSVLAKVIVDRSQEKVEGELQTLARNWAASRGDTVVATSNIENGEQNFDVYQCR